MVTFGLSVAAVLDGTQTERNLDVVELWSGVDSIVCAAIASGPTAQGFDKYRINCGTNTTDPITTEYIILEADFRKAFELVLRV